MWNLAVEHNQHAVAVDEKFIQDRHPSGIYPMGYYPHNLDVMLSALSMLGRDSDAVATARKISGIAKESVPYVNLGFSFFNVLCTVIALPLLEKFGRRTLLLVPSAVLAVSLVVLCGRTG